MVVQHCCYAGSTGVTSVQWLNPTTTGNTALVRPNGSASGQPSCATNANIFAIDLTTPAGRANYAAILVALGSGQTLTFFGNSTCNVYAGYEDLNGVRLQ